MSDDAANTTLKKTFFQCEEIVESIIQNQLIADKNDKVRLCVERLQTLAKHVESLSLFSTNDDIDELPTSSVRYLLVPAYLAFSLEVLNVSIEQRAVYLKAAKIHYRQFLENLLVYRLINFKLPWLDETNDDDDNSNENRNIASSSTKSTNVDLAEASLRRTEKITRLRQRDELEQTLAKLRFQRHRQANIDDDAAEREILFTLIRLWAIRALNSLSSIDDPPMQTFIIAKTAAQKKVFGLGYPSVPTYTVDEWYDQMMAKRGGLGQPSSIRIDDTEAENNEDANKRDDDADEDAIDETEDESRRRAAMRNDEWRDTHRRGWGNTHNRG